MKLISFQEWRAKHKRDYNHGKSGFVGGNPRFGKANKLTYVGNLSKRRSAVKHKDQKTNFDQKED